MITLGQCAFCDQQANYICPKCSQHYCSLKCYKSEPHKICSEKFYQQNVQEELSRAKADTEEKIRMAKVLKKYNVGSNVQDWKYEIPEAVRDEYKQLASQDINTDNSQLTDAEEQELRSLIGEADFDKLWALLSDEEKLEFIKEHGDPATAS